VTDARTARSRTRPGANRPPHTTTLANASHQSWVDEPERIVGAIDEFWNGRWPEGAADID
jgi:pimeloyl-ACP methyl ester carboxylesterase